MKRAISELKKVVHQLTEKLAPFQQKVEDCISKDDFAGAKEAIVEKAIEQAKIDTLKTVIVQLESELPKEEETSIRQKTLGIDEKGKTPAVAPVEATKKS